MHNERRRIAVAKSFQDQEMYEIAERGEYGWAEGGEGVGAKVPEIAG